MIPDRTIRIRVIHDDPVIRAAVDEVARRAGLVQASDDCDLMLVGARGPNADPGRVLVDRRLNGDLAPALVILTAEQLPRFDPRLGGDIVVWPCHPAELRARAVAVSPHRAERWIHFGDRRVDRSTGAVEHPDGHTARLSPQGLRLLRCLMTFGGQELSRDELHELVWPDRPSEMSRAVDFAVMRLRTHIEVTPSAPSWLQTVRHVGYRLRITRPATVRPSHPTRTGHREAELRAALAALRAGRSVCVSGPAGMGKTRLARELAAHWHASADAGRVIWHDLVGRPAHHPGGHPLAAPTAGGPPRPRREANRGPDLHILDGLKEGGPTDELIDSAVAAPRPPVLVTSRQSWSGADVAIHLEPLDPEERLEVLTALIGAPAEAAPVRRALRRLASVVDGAPLSLEIEAARFAGGVGADLADAIGARVRDIELQGGGADPALVRSILGELGPRLRDALQACAMFTGPFTLAMATDMMAAVHDPLDLLEVLSDRRLIRLRPARSEEQRMELIPTVRAEVRRGLMPYEAVDLEHRLVAAMANRLARLDERIATSSSPAWRRAREEARGAIVRAVESHPAIERELMALLSTTAGEDPAADRAETNTPTDP